MTPRDDATERQVQAARPDASTWLAANAGSGKTRVLTDRVARLLLSGVQPQHILCLTYTKAAASEMQNRLFKRLGAWAMLDNAKLRQELDELGIEGTITPEKLRDARTLFARAIETPGGLKIQTIHSFCASLLRRFPLEAGVSPQFTEIEDRAGALLRAEIVDDLADGAQMDLVRLAADHLAGDDMEGLSSAIVRNRAAFDTQNYWSDLCALFDIAPDLTEADVLDQVFQPGTLDVIGRLIPALESGMATDQKAAATLRRVSAKNTAGLVYLEGIFLTGAKAKEPFSAKIGSVPTKRLRESLTALMPEVDDLMRRVEDARTARVALEAAQKTKALWDFAAAFLPEYDRRKQMRGWLDFDDLITKARQLLNDANVAAWVLYRLDGGIDHILVDEAQDTSPAQWDVIEKLAQEFTTGLGARADTTRTIFVVGDKKQSIYSFQGADPDAFDRMQADFAQRLTDSGARLHDLTLEYSFRSSEAILRLVDLVFLDLPHAGFPRDALHRAFKADLPGRVDIWPVVEPVDETDDRVWYDPVDRRSPQHHTVILAERIAKSMRRMIEGGETIPVDTDTPGLFRRRPVRPGDFLILVQRRSDLFAEIIRACKAEGLPIAGADRLKVGAELAVKDLAALLSFLATPEDNLSLATALRSPLFGWTEQQLFTLAHRRTEPYLWQALRKQTKEHSQTLGVLNDLRAQTDFLRPFDLIERILTRHDGRRLLLGRLGREAEDGINALLSQALAYERSDVPSLTGFLAWMETDDLEIKRQIDNAGDMVRVMTVHGAKGLEAPIVILPDTGLRNPPQGDDILTIGSKAVWRTAIDKSPEAIEQARDAAREKQQNERLRLLYVALTRAEKWLIVAAAGRLDAKSGDTWYQRVETALGLAGAVSHDMPGGKGLRLEHAGWDNLEMELSKVTETETRALPPHFTALASDPVERPKTLSPSDLGGPKALPGEAGQDEEQAKLRGTRIHLLLEHLPRRPQTEWAAIAARILDLSDTAVLADLLSEATAVLTHSGFTDIFAAKTLAEVSITAPIKNARIHGAIDRLIVSDTTVLAVDFKTNAVVPKAVEQCPEGLLRQMGAYAHGLALIYPDHSIQTAILWTKSAQLMYLPHDLVTHALYRSPYLDDPGLRS
jgi:ATP-dependent helicase/nuclease subunit A